MHRYPTRYRLSMAPLESVEALEPLALEPLALEPIALQSIALEPAKSLREPLLHLILTVLLIIFAVRMVIVHSPPPHPNDPLTALFYEVSAHRLAHQVDCVFTEEALQRLPSGAADLSCGSGLRRGIVDAVVVAVFVSVARPSLVGLPYFFIVSVLSAIALDGFR